MRRDLRLAEGNRRHPPEAELTARPAEIPAWEDMDASLRPVLARQVEIYATFLAHTGFHVGRLIDALDGMGVLVTGHSQTLYQNMGRLSENSVLNLKNKSHEAWHFRGLPCGARD